MGKKKFISQREKPDPVFLPFSYTSHKENKVSLMKAELSALKCLRIVENLKRLQDEKSKLKRELQHMLASSVRDFEKATNEMPLINNMREIKRVEESTSTDFSQPYEEKLRTMASTGTDTTALGKELSVIQEKLKKLSNYQ